MKIVIQIMKDGQPLHTLERFACGQREDFHKVYCHLKEHGLELRLYDQFGDPATIEQYESACRDEEERWAKFKAEHEAALVKQNK